MIAEQQKCLDGAMLAELLAGRLPAERFSLAMEHIESCERCLHAAEEHSRDFQLPSVSPPAQSMNPKFDLEPECAAVVGNLLIQPPQAFGDRSATQREAPLPREMLGPYRLIGSLGVGGMGTVYLAEHQRLKRQVAIKLLPRDKLARTGWLDRFNREMTAIAALEHPNIVRALDAGDEEEWHYLVMEYLDGLDLNRVARRIPDMPFGTACEITRQAALGLAAIHDAGMVHRDIKPSNIFLTRLGSVKLLDLGLVLDGESPLLADERLTTVGHLMGTLPFMAREQLDDARNVDWRTDIYGLGATLFRILCGRPPYGSADNLARTIQTIGTTEAPSLGSLRSDLPIELVTIVDRMLNSDAAKRPQSALEVAALLQPFCVESGPKSLIRAAMLCSSESVASECIAPSPLAVQTSNKTPRSRWPWWIAASLIPFAFAAGIILTITTDQGTLVIETSETNTEVKVTQGDHVVQQLEVTQNQPAKLTLRSGKYVVELTGVDSDRMEIKNNQILLSRGDKQIVQVIQKRESVSSTLGETSSSKTAFPSKTFQDKSLEDWMGILSRERSAESLALAMEGVNSLADTPEEKAAAAKLFLEASRIWGSNSSRRPFSGGGRGGSGGGGGGREVNAVPSQPTPSSAVTFMSALERFFPKFYSGAPEIGLLAIANELENGTERSHLACLCLLHKFNGSLFDQVLKAPEHHPLLHRLDSLISGVLTKTSMAEETREKGFRTRIELSDSLHRDWKQDPQLIDWAKRRLERSQEYLTSDSAPSPLLDSFAGKSSFRLLEKTQLDLSPLLMDLMGPRADASDGEFESTIQELCRRDPVALALTSESMLRRGVSIYENKLVSDTFANHHPRPIDAILSTLYRQRTSPTFRESIHKRLLVRLVLETDLHQDPAVVPKLAYAANAFAVHEIPDANAQEVITAFLACLRKRSLGSGQFRKQNVWPNEEAQSFDNSSFQNIWTAARLDWELHRCIAKSPRAAIPAITIELRAGNHGVYRYLRTFEKAIAFLTRYDKNALYTVDSEEQRLLAFLESSEGKDSISKLDRALEAAIEQMEKNLDLKDTDWNTAFQVFIRDRLLIQRFFGKESDSVSASLRFLFASGLKINQFSLVEEMAKREGHKSISLHHLLELAQSHGSLHSAQSYEGAEVAEAVFVDRIFEVNPSEFNDFFVKFFERLAANGTSKEITDSFSGNFGTNGLSLWHAIVRKLSVDPIMRQRTEVAILGIIERIGKEGIVKDAAQIIASLKSLRFKR